MSASPLDMSGSPRPPLHMSPYERIGWGGVGEGADGAIACADACGIHWGGGGCMHAAMRTTVSHTCGMCVCVCVCVCVWVAEEADGCMPSVCRL
jgi:hypothetical protein